MSLFSINVIGILDADEIIKLIGKTFNNKFNLGSRKKLATIGAQRKIIRYKNILQTNENQNAVDAASSRFSF